MSNAAPSSPSNPQRPTSPSDALSRWRRVVSSQAALNQVPIEERWQAWGWALQDLLEDRRLHEALARRCEIHPTTARAGVEAVLGGLVGEGARPEFERAFRLSQQKRRGRSTPAGCVVLASNLPFLAAQTLFFAFACGRPTFFKQATSLTSGLELLLGTTMPEGEMVVYDGTDQLLSRLTEHLSLAGAAFGVGRWRGGAPEFAGVESALATQAQPLIVYGDDESVSAYRRRREEAPDMPPVVGFGAKFSVAVVQLDAADGQAFAQLSARIADRLSRDIALFEQQGCLSPRIVFVLSEDLAVCSAFLRALAQGLRRCAVELPPTPPSAYDQALMQQAVLGNQMAGREVEGGPWGTVMLSQAGEWPDLLPGRRSIWLVPVAPQAADELVLRRQGELQGVAMAGQSATLSALAQRLASAGVRITAPGDLQRTDATWRNSGVDLAAVFA